METVRFLFVFVAIAAFLISACGGPAQAAEPAPIVEPPTAEEPATSAPTATQAEPVESVAPTQSQYAPFCETAAANGCEAPAITMIDPKYCVDKVPYVIISVPPGTTYKSSDLDMECNQEMHNDGKLRIACHSLSGKDNWSYDLELCNGACIAPALQTETGQCPEGYGYDPANSCCAAPAPASSNGCTTFTVDFRVCYGE